MSKGHYVSLRPMLIEDIPLMAQWFIDNDLVITYVGSDLASVEQIKSFFDHALKHPEHRRDFIIMDNKSNRPIGAISLENINWLHRNSTHVVFLGEQGMREFKYIADAHIQCLNVAFNVLNLHRVEWKMFSLNKRMLKQFARWRKLLSDAASKNIPPAYLVEGRMVDAAFVMGQYCDIELFAVLRQNYNLNQALMKALLEEL